MFKKFFKLLFYFFGFIALAGVAALLTFKAIESGKYTDAPRIIGATVTEAKEILESKGLFLEIQGEGYDANVPSGRIMVQDIKEGEKIRKGGSVRVFVSKGKATFTIPYLERMDINDVKLTLAGQGVDIGNIKSVHSDTVEKDKVIAQRPLMGHSTENKVNLLVSAGPYEVFYRCPSFINMTAAEAKRIADALGLRFVEEDSGSVVVFQKPEAGAVIKKGDSVEVRLGRKGGFWF